MQRSRRRTASPDPDLSDGADLASTIVLVPEGRWETPNLGEIWAFRELLYFLTWRDVKVRYKQTAIGAGWAILQPLITMVVFTLVFGNLLGVPSGGVPYPVFAFVGLLPWNYFSAALFRASGSLVYDANVISKTYFPRVLVPVAAVLSPVIDFGIAFAFLVALLLFYSIAPGIRALTLPLFALFALVTALGFGLWSSAINVRFRDVAYTLPFVMQFWLLITPVAYASQMIPQPWRTISAINPMTGVVDGFRWALLDVPAFPVETILPGAIVSLAVLGSGVLYFHRAEPSFADVV